MDNIINWRHIDDVLEHVCQRFQIVCAAELKTVQTHDRLQRLFCSLLCMKAAWSGFAKRKNRSASSCRGVIKYFPFLFRPISCCAGHLAATFKFLRRQ
jgi:hypothetical protein